jgi:hypothetical protein
MTGREFLEAEAKRFHALDVAEQEEAIKEQQERLWLIGERDRAMALPAPPSAPSLPLAAKETTSKAEVKNGSQTMEYGPLFAPGCYCCF